MELINRYIYAVTERLPEKQRDDIKKELKSLIEDMLEERMSAGETTQEDIESVLQELGHPKELAAKYRGFDRYLIGPMLYGSYLSTLKVVLISIAIALTVMFATDTLFSTAGVLEQVTRYLVSIFTLGAQGFFWVTLVFAWMDHRQENEKSRDKDEKVMEWKASDLPQIPDKRAQIKMSEPITGIFFTILFTVVCLYAVEWLGLWRFQEGRTFIPFLNADVFRNYLPLVWVIAALGILKGCIRMIARKRSGKLLAYHIAISAAITVLLSIILMEPSIYNSDFIQQMVAAGILSPGGEGYMTVSTIWAGVAEWTVALVVIFTLIDIATEAYHTYRVKSQPNRIEW